jgi:hypothetical protein
LSQEIKRGPEHQQADRHSNDLQRAAEAVLPRQTRLEQFGKATGAEDAILMFADALPAKVPAARGAAGDGLAGRVMITALLRNVFDWRHLTSHFFTTKAQRTPRQTVPKVLLGVLCVFVVKKI